LRQTVFRRNAIGQGGTIQVYLIFFGEINQNRTGVCTSVRKGVLYSIT